MKIQVLDVKTSQKTSNAGKPYQNVEIAYKNIDSGKVESKNITQYSKVFKEVADASVTMFYDVETKKDEKGYWQWESFKVGEPAEAPNVPTSFHPDPNKKSFPTPKSNYETPEERAKRQVFIVKQSSLTAALKFAELNKEKPTVEGILALAQELTDWVTSEKKVDLFEIPNDMEVV